MSQKAAIKRRWAHRIGFAHLCTRQRPGWKKRDAAASAQRLRRLIETERRIKAGPKKK